MSYSSITNKSNVKNTIEAEIKEEDKNQQILDEYEYNQQEIIKNQKHNKHNNKNKNNYNYKKYNENTYNIPENSLNNNISQYNPDFCVQPRFINIYNKKYCIKWLAYNIDTNYYHYDYCVKLFEILMKWVRYNNFVLKTNELPLLGKFISLMYLLSNKKKYTYELQ